MQRVRHAGGKLERAIEARQRVLHATQCERGLAVEEVSRGPAGIGEDGTLGGVAGQRGIAAFEREHAQQFEGFGIAGFQCEALLAGLLGEARLSAAQVEQGQGQAAEGIGHGRVAGRVRGRVRLLADALHRLRGGDPAGPPAP